MAKLVLMKKNEISVPEGQKGKQIAVKEVNITSLKDFYKNNYQVPTQTVTPTSEVAPVQPMEPLASEAPVMSAPTKENNIVNNEEIVANNIIQEQPVIANPQVLEEPVAISISPTVPETPVVENVEETKPEEAIKLTSENEETISQMGKEELDPELREIKERLDKVIEDLNNYKKKIKILETEVNQNLEKSREVLKDTQAAAQIMSIQQERQKQINDEISGGGTLETDASRVLEKNVA